MSANCEVIVIYGKFEAIQKPDSVHIVCNTYIFIKSNLYLTKNEKRSKKISNAVLMLLFCVKCWFFAKNIQTLQKHATCGYLRTKFQVSSVMKTSFMLGRGD